MAGVSGVKRTRSSINPDVDFPEVDPKDWQKSGYLPTFCEVIGAIRKTVSKKVSANEAVKNVTDKLINEWTSRNVYTKTAKIVISSLLAEYQEFLAVRKLINKGNPTDKTLQRYAELNGRKDDLYDIFVGLPEKGVNAMRAKERLKTLEAELGVRMSQAEFDYLDSQRSKKPRHEKLVCFPTQNQIDPVWEEQQRRKLSLQKYQEKQIEKNDGEFK